MTGQYFTVAFALSSIFFGGLVDSTPFNITSPPVTNWGVWGDFQRCPTDTYVQGFQIKTQAFIGILGDDTAANSLRLFCGDPFNASTVSITSLEGSKGNWGSVYSCYPGYINGFQMRVEANQGSGDDTATNNLRVFCSNAPDPNQYVEGDGLNFGLWGEVRRCYTDQAICALQTQIENCNQTDDCTSLNNILTECCDKS